MDKWTYNLGQRVELIESGEIGTITGRAEYLDSRPDSYYVRYKAGDGRQCHVWWDERDIKAVED